jgi:hypothetical protein
MFALKNAALEAIKDCVVSGSWPRGRLLRSHCEMMEQRVNPERSTDGLCRANHPEVFICTQAARRTTEIDVWKCASESEHEDKRRRRVGVIEQQGHTTDVLVSRGDEGRMNLR